MWVKGPQADFDLHDPRFDTYQEWKKSIQQR
jgi:hypothetical protein